MTADPWKSFLDEYDALPTRNPILISILRQASLLEMSDSRAVVACTNAAMKQFLEKRVLEIEIALSSHLKKNTRVVFEVKSQTKRREEPLFSFQPSIEDVFIKAGIAPRFRFDNFAVSASNNVAFAAAQAVSKNPGTAYNPLFFYGGVGVGKTHLAQAIGRTILEQNQDASVLFCPGDRFTNELIESIQNKTTPRFRKKYRTLRLLIVDDIQFIAGKQTVQEEFFHTFNTVISSGGQIILTSDRPPQEIKNLEDRLRSRFSGGLIVDLQSPDFELRTAILLIKAKEKNIPIQMEAAKVVAEQITDSRALEGALISLYARTVGGGGEIGLEEVESFFRGTETKKQRHIAPHDVIRIVSSYYHIKPSTIKSSTRTDAVALPRQIVMYILRKELRMKLEEIATLLHRKDHTTVMHAYEKITAACIQDPSFKSDIDRIIQMLIQ